MFDLNKQLEKLQQKLDTAQAATDQLKADQQDRTNQLSELSGRVDRMIDNLSEDQRKKIIERLQNRTNDQK